MATTIYPLPTTWGSTARYTAAGDVDVLLSNPNDDTTIHFEITTSDTTPTINPSASASLTPKLSQSIALATDDRLWITAAKGYAAVTL